MFKPSLKGYKIPKIKSSNISGSQDRRPKTNETSPEADDGIVPDLCHHLPADPNDEKKQKQEQVLEKLLSQETSDYASNSSGDSLDCDSDGGDSSTKRSNLTPPDRDDETCSITPTITTDLPGMDEYYVILKSEDELEYVDVFTDDGIFLMQQADEEEGGQNQEDYYENKNCEMHEEERQQPHSVQPQPLFHSVMNDNENQSHYENESQEMLDLELGTVETVIESEESFGSEGGGGGLHFNELDPVPSSLLPHFNTEPLRSSHGHSLKAKKNAIRQALEEKSCTKFRNLKAKSTRTPNNLFTSVLEKTLLVRLERCDGALTSMPKLQRQHRVEEPPPPEDESTFIPQIMQEEDVAIVSQSSDYISPLSPELITIVDETIDEISTSNSCQSPRSPEIVEQSNESQSLRKRKHSKEKQDEVKNEEKWDIVNLSDLNNADLNNESNELKPLQRPIKLMIKRRRHEEEEEDNRNLMDSTNTSSPQFFNGKCKICGTSCSYKDAKTYYATTNESKPFRCCTCFDIFDQEEWSAHNKTCHTVEELSCLNEISNNNVMHMQRDFICPNCFNSMSKLLD